MGAATVASALVTSVDFLVGTGRDRGVYWTGPRYGKSARKVLISAGSPPQDTGLLGLAHGLRVGFFAGCGAAIGSALGFVGKSANALFSLKAINRPQRVVEGMASVGAVAGAGAYLLSMGGIFDSIIIGCARMVTAAVRASLVGAGYALGACLGAVVGWTESALSDKKYATSVFSGDPPSFDGDYPSEGMRAGNLSLA